MKPLPIAALVASMSLAGSGFAADTPNCIAQDYGPWQYELYVDEPTGYAFIKTPCGWHFVRKIESERLAEAIRMSRLTPQSADAESDSPDLAPQVR
jgi:hypothetical protein